MDDYWTRKGFKYKDAEDTKSGGGVERRGKKRTVSDRLDVNPRHDDVELLVEGVPHEIHDLEENVVMEGSDEELGTMIAARLKEPKEEIIYEVIHDIGRDVALSIFSKTQLVEAEGGMMIKNGARRRTPGGVFLQLLRETKDPIIDKEKVKKFFNNQREKNENEKRKALKAKNWNSKSLKQLSSAPLSYPQSESQGHKLGKHPPGKARGFGPPGCFSSKVHDAGAGFRTQPSSSKPSGMLGPGLHVLRPATAATTKGSHLMDTGLTTTGPGRFRDGHSSYRQFGQAKSHGVRPMAPEPWTTQSQGLMGVRSLAPEPWTTQSQGLIGVRPLTSEPWKTQSQGLMGVPPLGWEPGLLPLLGSPPRSYGDGSSVNLQEEVSSPSYEPLTPPRKSSFAAGDGLHANQQFISLEASSSFVPVQSFNNDYDHGIPSESVGDRNLVVGPGLEKEPPWRAQIRGDRNLDMGPGLEKEPAWKAQIREQDRNLDVDPGLEKEPAWRAQIRELKQSS